MEIGIFGGAFNPPHIAHLIAAQSVLEQLRLDRIVFVPAADPPHRSDLTRIDADHRLEMTRLAIAGNPSFDVSDIELQRSGRSYTIETIIAFQALHPRAKLHLLIGSDNLAEFHTWKSPEEIIARCELVVFARPGFDQRESKNDFARSASLVSIPQLGISATEIRRRVKLGKTIRYLVPKEVENYILQNGLYRS